ncbi:MAG: hypothetical protein LBH06_09105 [Rikenellaceae bacterium]|nr:hypothetical protein [Rikenellaceae bacterium]
MIRRLFVFVFLLVAPSGQARVREYGPCFGRIAGERSRIVLRRASGEDGSINYLTLNTETFETSFEKGPLAIIPCRSLDEIEDDSPYFRLRRAISTDYEHYRGGVASCGGSGYMLTCDLCPSARGLDRDFVDYALSIDAQPIYICVSGRWIERHGDDLAWLLDRANLRSNTCASACPSARSNCGIVWVNHSYSHYYNPRLPEAQNFLLRAGTDLRREALDNERIMLEHGLVPSPFFRYPGLVSDRKLSQRLLDWGLIPLGSNAWLAKGERPAPGSIVLVHINGNEPSGLAIFRQWTGSPANEKPASEKPAREKGEPRERGEPSAQGKTCEPCWKGAATPVWQRFNYK